MATKVGFQPLSKNIVVGNVSPKGMWVGKKTDVTDSAINAVAEFFLSTDTTMEFEVRGVKYKMGVWKEIAVKSSSMPQSDKTQPKEVVETEIPPTKHLSDVDHPHLKLI